MQQSSEHTATSESGFVKDQTGENYNNNIFNFDSTSA